jgi:hypothetical protein
MPRWTPAARARQRELINRVKPWQKATGPTSDHGKLQSARNGPHHAPRAPGQHPKQLRLYRAKLWKAWGLQMSLAPIGFFDPVWAKSLADQIVATEAALGIPQVETVERITRSLARRGRR